MFDSTEQDFRENFRLFDSHSKNDPSIKQDYSVVVVYAGRRLNPFHSKNRR